MKREKFNLSFSSELLKQLRQIAHERTQEGTYTAVNELIEDAVRLWLPTGGTDQAENTSRSTSNVIDYTEYDPIFTTLGRLLRSDQAAHVRTFLLYADEYINNHLDSMHTEDRQAEALLLAEEAEKHAREVLGDKMPPEEDEPAIRGGNAGPDQPNRKRAS